MSGLTVLSLISTAAAWHGSGHSLTGWFFDHVRPKDGSFKSRVMMENALATFTLDTKDGCKYNTWGNMATFSDNVKDSTSMLSDWHWNDIIGHLSYYGEDFLGAQISEATGKFDLIKATDRNGQNAVCTDTAEGCYGDRGSPAFIDNGELAQVISDVKRKLFAVNDAGDHTGTGTQGSNPVSPIIRGFMLRYFIHCMGDSHNPLHSGSMFNRIGQDDYCCPLETGYDETTKKCKVDADGNVPPFGYEEAAACDGSDLPRYWCKPKNDFDHRDGHTGDYGGNHFYVKITGDDMSYLGDWKQAEVDGELAIIQNLHALWDSALGMFESTRADVPDQEYLICNEDSTGALKLFTVDETSLDETGKIVTTPKDYHAGESRGIEFETHPDFVATIKCHIKHMTDDLPQDKLKDIMHDQINAALAGYYGASAPEIPPTFFDPLTTDHYEWQDQMNWMRHWMIYYPFMQKADGLKGASCEATGTATLPANWVKNSREVVRNFITLGGYRIANSLDELAEFYVPSPNDTLYGNYSEICEVTPEKVANISSSSVAAYTGTAIAALFGASMF